MDAGASKQRSVIVVDDHPAVRLLCRIGLEAAGIRVTEAADGAEAIERIRRDRPDLILLDIMMPQLSGWEVAAQLMKQATRPGRACQDRDGSSRSDRAWRSRITPRRNVWARCRLSFAYSAP